MTPELNNSEPRKPQNVGECDACPLTNVERHQIRDMMLCNKCYTAEVEATREAKQVIEKAHRIDNSIQLKQDVFNAATVSFTELWAAIKADSEIPENKKNEALVKEAERRIEQFNKVIRAEEEATMVKRNERHSWSTQTLAFISKLQIEEREKYSKYNITYQPKPISKKNKTTKPAGPVKKSVGFDKKAVAEAASKYDVPMAGVQSIYISKPGISYDEAAKQLARMLGKLPEEKK